MKYNQITFQTFVGAIKHGWKRIILITAVFLVIGVGASFLFADQGAAETTGMAETLPKADFFTAEKESICIYYQKINNLQESYDALQEYVVVLSKGEGLTASQRDEVEKIQERLENYERDYLVSVIKELDNPLLVPEKYMEEAAEVAYWQLGGINYSLIAAQAAAELLKTMTPPPDYGEKVEGEVAIETYVGLWEKAADYGELLQKKAVYEEELAVYEADPEGYVKKADDFNERLKESYALLNELQEDAVKVADEICAENHLLLLVDPEETGEVAPVLHHGHSEVTREEASIIIVSFTGMTGLCVALFWAVCKEARKSGKNSDK